MDNSYQLSKETGLTNIVTIVVYVLYFIVYQMYMNGQTIGKRIMKIRVVKNEDGTFTMLLNLGDLMATTSGTFTWEETDEFYIYLHFDDLQGSIGSDAVVILTGPDGLYFMSEGFGLMGYGDSTGFFDRM